MPLAQTELAGLRATRGKLVGLEDLASLCDTAHNAGQCIVLSHGVFDLFHIGHLHHFQAAKAHGDVLVVTITADEHVNKGPDRPAFKAAIRAELLASIDIVDWVAVVHSPAADPAIRAVRPDVYVKGGEYDDPANDITGKITHEQALVEQFGGRLEFTYEATYSSSTLLNGPMKMLDPQVRRYVEPLRERGGERLLADLFARVEKLRILVVGETIIDRYQYVAPMGKSAKENIIATLYEGEEIFAGGVIAASNHLSALCPDVEVMTLVGDPTDGGNHEDLIKEQSRFTSAATFVRRMGGPTVEKTRFVEPTYVRKLFEVYRMDDRPLPDDVQDAFHEGLRTKARQADLVVVCDFGHGFVNDETVRILEEEAAYLAVNAQTNAGNLGYNLVTKYNRVDFLCIDVTEARLAAQDKHSSLEEIAGHVLPGMVQCGNVVVTHGSHGCFAWSSKLGRTVHLPALTKQAVDTVGAGDAFFVVAAPLLAVGASCDLASFVGNVAGAIKVNVVGHRQSIDRLQLQRYLNTLMK